MILSPPYALVNPVTIISSSLQIASNGVGSDSANEILQKGW